MPRRRLSERILVSSLRFAKRRCWLAAHAVLWLVVWLAASCLLSMPLLAQGNADDSVLEQKSERETHTLDSYAALIDAALAVIDDESRPPATRTEDAIQLLANASEVELASGERVALTPLFGENEPLTFSVVRARLKVVQSQLARLDRDRSAERLAALAAVLAGPEFTRQPTLWQRFRRWLRETLAPFLPDTTVELPQNQRAGELRRFAGWAVAAVGGLAIIFLLSYWLQGLLGSFVTDVRQRNGEASQHRLTASAARERAYGEASAGDYRHAVRSLYLSALLAMEEKGIFPADRSRTNREMLEDVQSSQRLAGHLRPVVETFDTVWYGEHEPDETTLDAYAQEIDQLAASAREDQPL